MASEGIAFKEKASTQNLWFDILKSALGGADEILDSVS